MVDTSTQWKCKCGWVHVAVSLEEAMASVQRSGLTGTIEGRDMLAAYMLCFGCGTPTSEFVQANPGDAPPLANLSHVVIPKK